MWRPCFARAACAFAFDFSFGAALVLPPAAVFGLRGAPSFLLAPFCAEAGGGPTGAPGAAILAAVSSASVWVMLFVYPFLRSSRA